ncbi:MAG: hypothetical protein V4497_00535 [Bacteroidota bacterium]
MNAKKGKSEVPKVEEPTVPYSVSKSKQGTEETTFDFDVEFAKGYTPEQAKAESIRRIREWWGK